MSMPTREELLWRFARTDDPEVLARRHRILEVLLQASPETQQELIEKGIEKGRMAEARAALQRVLALRQFTLSPDDEARIAACTDLATLERWHDQAVTAASLSEALR